MKSISLPVVVLSAVAFVLSLTGCETGAPAVKNMVGAYTVVVGAAPDKTVAAARRAVEAMKLFDVTSTSTKVDGHVAAKTAQGEVVAITISQVSENESNVTVRVGVNDEATSTEIIRRIKGGL